MKASSVKEPILTLKICSGLEQPFAFATTLMLPPVDPTIVVMEFVIDVPVHPLGNTHVYVLAPLIGVIEYV